jgi:hypothetical protein
MFLKKLFTFSIVPRATNYALPSLFLKVITITFLAFSKTVGYIFFVRPISLIIKAVNEIKVFIFLVTTFTNFFSQVLSQIYFRSIYKRNLFLSASQILYFVLKIIASMKAVKWYTFFKISFGFGVVLFFVSIISTLVGWSGGFLREFGTVGLLVSTFIFVIAYVCFQKYKLLLSTENV